jgi:spermidine/putrescine transport system permease protein
MSRDLSRANARRSALLRSPGMTLIAALYVIPMTLIVVYSFLTRKVGGGVSWDFTLDAWREVFRRDPAADYYNGFATVLIRSVIWSVLTTVITLCLSLPMAVFISSRRSALAKNALLVAVVIPFWTSMLVRIFAMRFLLANTGPLNNALESLGLERQTFLNSSGVVIGGLIYTSLPFMILPLYAAVERVDHRVLDASRDLGAGPAQVFRTAFLPMINVGVTTGCMLVFVLSVSQYLVPTLLGGGKANMIANVVEQQFGEGQNWPLGSAIAVFLTVLTLVGLWFNARNSDETLL